MKTHQFAIPDEHEIEVFLGRMGRAPANQEIANPTINTEHSSNRVEIVLGNNSRNPGIVQEIYGKLE